MSTIQKKEKGLQKYSFRGYTPEQLNELTQEQVVELFRARMRRRFARSISCITKKSSTDTTDSTWSARRPRPTPPQERSQSPLKLILGMPSSCPKWSAASLLSTTERPSTLLKSSSTWSADIWVSSLSLTSTLDTERPVSVPPRDLLTLPSNDVNSLLSSLNYHFLIVVICSSIVKDYMIHPVSF